jgi:Ser-tRNA(Ala) deacylase AlaX
MYREATALEHAYCSHCSKATDFNVERDTYGNPSNSKGVQSMLCSICEYRWPLDYRGCPRCRERTWLDYNKPNRTPAQAREEYLLAKMNWDYDLPRIYKGE